MISCPVIESSYAFVTLRAENELNMPPIFYIIYWVWKKGILVNMILQFANLIFQSLKYCGGSENMSHNHVFCHKNLNSKINSPCWIKSVRIRYIFTFHIFYVIIRNFMTIIVYIHAGLDFLILIKTWFPWRHCDFRIENYHPKCLQNYCQPV